jgi:two-component system chemotaxis response regulator CheB
VTLQPPKASASSSVKALAIASSTGGPQALMALFGALKGKLGGIPIFITQHMPATFTTILADHLAKAGERPCKEGADGDAVKNGQTYIAPGNYHMTVEKQDKSLVIRTNQNLPESFCRPAADPMLRSLSAIYGSDILVVVLTGMGADGLEGSKIVVSNGGRVIAQDEASSVVWGMPGAVAEGGLCQAVLPLTDIAPYLMRTIPNAS